MGILDSRILLRAMTILSLILVNSQAQGPAGNSPAQATVPATQGIISSAAAQSPILVPNSLVISSATPNLVDLGVVSSTTTQSPIVSSITAQSPVLSNLLIDSSSTHSQPLGPAASDGSQSEQRQIFFEPKEKVVVGTQHYFSNDAGLQLALPEGFNINGEYSFYRSDLSSRTATISVGGSKFWDEGFLGFTCSWTPVANNFRSHAVETTGAYYTPSEDFRTAIGGTFNVTYNTEIIYSTGPHHTTIISDLDIRQMTATFNLKQSIYDTRVTVDFGKSSYDREISRLSAKINPNSTRLQGLAGLLQGFPDMEWKLGVYHDLGAIFTAWTTYDHIRLLVAQQAGHGNADSYMFGVDAYPTSWLAATLQYNYLTETGQPQSSQWGLLFHFKI